MTHSIVLYLRPFATDGKVMVDSPEKSSLWRNLLPTSSIGTEARITLEELLLQSTSDLGLLVAIGKTVEIIGAGKIIASEEEWKDYFRSLSKKAACIVSVPSTHPSTLWELEWLGNERLFDRVVMVFTELHTSVDHHRYSMHELGAQLRSRGWRLPDSTTSSTLVRFGPNGHPSEIIDKSKHKIRHVRSIVQGAMNSRA